MHVVPSLLKHRFQFGVFTDYLVFVLLIPRRPYNANYNVTVSCATVEHKHWMWNISLAVFNSDRPVPQFGVANVFCGTP